MLKEGLYFILAEALGLEPKSYSFKDCHPTIRRCFIMGCLTRLELVLLLSQSNVLTDYTINTIKNYRIYINEHTYPDII